MIVTSLVAMFPDQASLSRDSVISSPVQRKIYQKDFIKKQ